MNNSYWVSSTKDMDIQFNSLDEDINTDICIIGGGITGISTAYELTRVGLNVVVVEREPSVCSRTTANTTAKITSQHDLFYKYLINSFSETLAKQYLYANQEAVSNIKTIITRENIDCDFEVKDNYIFTQNFDEVEKIKDEVLAINSLGIDAEFVTKCNLPFNILGAIKTKEQAQFHPRKYVLRFMQ